MISSEMVGRILEGMEVSVQLIEDIGMVKI